MNDVMHVDMPLGQSINIVYDTTYSKLSMMLRPSGLNRE